MYARKYHKYKQKYLACKNKSALRLDTHTAPGFINKHTYNLSFQNKSNIYQHPSAIILPHAAITFIQSITDKIFAQIFLGQRYDSIIFLATNHKADANYQPKAGCCSFGNWEMGLLKVESLDIIFDDAHFYREHSYLSIMPYLFEVGVPMYLFSVGVYDPRLVAAIRRIMTPRTLLIGNTDLRHCGPVYNTPCPSNIKADNEKQIAKIINKTIAENDPMCGYAAIRVFNDLNDGLCLTHMYTSSDEIEKSSSSVGYAGIVYVPNMFRIYNLPKLFLEYVFSSNNRNKYDLIDGYKHTIPKYLQFVEAYQRCIQILIGGGSIQDIQGIFVTINSNGALRGCIGTFALLGDLIDTILDRTYETAFQDNRFKSVEKGELPTFTYKINFLGKPHPIAPSITDLQKKLIIGKHGLIVYFEPNCAATYLASVLTENYHPETLKGLQTIIDDLRKKSNCQSATISKIDLFECIEL